MRGPRARGSVPWLALALCTACSDPFPFDTTPGPGSDGQAEAPPEECPATREWLPVTPALEQFKPLPHPSTECPFYRGGWQTFLVATQPDAQGKPALQSYPTIGTIFDHSKPIPPDWSWLGDIKQAGGRQILIDQNGRSIYYGIHVNQAYADFIDAHGLRTKGAVQSIAAEHPDLFFPGGVVEFKSAWQEIDPSDPSVATYITTRTTVPHLSQDPATHEIEEDRSNPREVTVRLLALHVVFTLPGHPEFIWATFEHSTGAPDTKAADGKRDVAPIHPGDVNPDLSDPNALSDVTVISDTNHVLYRAGTTAQAGNRPIADADLRLDEASQTFPGQQTSIYRMFPASKSHTVDPDDAITALNHNIELLFAEAEARGTLDRLDKRGHYRMVGAQWMDKPAYFKNDSPIQNDTSSPFAGDPNFEHDIRTDGADSPLSILAGEDRLSSTAMESFTQGPASFSNCFTCHNTQAVTAKGVPYDRDRAGTVLLQPSLLNVSHVFSQFMLDESK